MPKILIVGGGYAGFYTAFKLQKHLRRGEAEVTLVDPLPYMTYQPFLPEVADGDKRIVLVDGEVAGAINRRPGEGEFRSNLAVGGSAEATTLTAREEEICAALGPELKRLGLIFVGIDVIGDYLAAFQEYDSSLSLPLLSHVMTVVVGGESDLLTPPESSQLIHSLVPNSELILLPDTGHMLPLERYVELNEIISTVAERVRTQNA